MKYAVGQQVRVRPDLTQGMKVPFGINADMQSLAGKVVTIYRAERESYQMYDTYTINEDKRYWNWHEDMFVSVDMSVDEAFELVLKGGLTDEQYEKIRRERG